MDAASKICDATKTRVVTLDGDVFDPSGMISGGSSGNLGTTLSKLSALASAKEELKYSEGSLSKTRSEWKNLSVISKEFGEMNDKLEVSLAELMAVQKHLSQTSFGMLSEQHASMKNDIK